MPHFQAQPTVCVNIRVISFSSAKDVFFHIWRRHRIWTQKLCTLYQNLKHSKAKGQDHSTIQPAPCGLELSTVQPTCSAHALVAQHPNRFICCLNDCCKNYFNPRLGVSQDPPKSVSLSPKRATKIDERLGPPFWAHFSLPKHMFALLYAWGYFKVDPQTSGFPDPNDESYLGDSRSIPAIHMKSQQSSVVSVHGRMSDRISMNIRIYLP